MCENHAAREDATVFPAWKGTLSGHRLREMGEKLEEIERHVLGWDGFEDAVVQIDGLAVAIVLHDEYVDINPHSPAQRREEVRHASSGFRS